MASETTAEKPSTTPTPDKPGSDTYARAKERLAAVDAKSDGSTEGDEQLRQAALAFIWKECLSLPDDEFMKLLTKIEEALKRKDAEVGSLLNQSRAALREISDELALKPLSNFDPNAGNPAQIAEYLQKATLTADRMKAFVANVESNADCASGLVKHWGETHPVRKALVAKGMETVRAVSSLDNLQKSLETDFKSEYHPWAKPAEIIESKKTANESFRKMTERGFPSVNDPKTEEWLLSVYKNGGWENLGTLIVSLKDNPRAWLGFVAEWKSYPNALRDNMRASEDSGVRSAADMMDGACTIIASAYGFDSNYLPTDFKTESLTEIDRFETRMDRARAVAEWNAANREFLTEKWNAIVRARLEGNATGTAVIGNEVEKFFSTEFAKQQAEANAYFYGLVPEQAPQAYADFQAIAGTRQLFSGLRNTYHDVENTGANGTTLDEKTKTEIALYDETFRNAVNGTWTKIVSRQPDGTLVGRNQDEFMQETRGERVSQAICDPVALANYLSIAYTKGGEKGFAKVLRTDFGNDYDALVLKFADASGRIGKWENARSKDWDAVTRTLDQINPDARDTLEGFLTRESETILANGTALGDGDLQSVREMMKPRHSQEKIDKVIADLKGKNTKEQFDILLSACPEMTHGEVQAVFLEISRKTKDVAAAAASEAERIIPKDEIMEYVPGFVYLKHALAESQPGETPQEAAARYSMLRNLQKANRLKASKFFESFWDNAEYFVKFLEKRAKDTPIHATECENFATWLKNKSLSRTSTVQAVSAKGVADEAGKRAKSEGPKAKAADSREGYHKAAAEWEKLWARIAAAAERADSLESEGKKKEAAELRERVFGDPAWTLSSELPNLDAAKKALAEIEKNSEFGFGEAAKARAQANADMKPDTANGGRPLASTNPETVASLITSELPVWRMVRVPVGAESTSVTVEKTNDASSPYVVRVDGKEAFRCSDKNLSANLQMAELLSKSGLAFLAPISSDLLKKASVAKGNLATAADGDFSDREKRELLSAAAKALGISDFPHETTDLSEMTRRFQSISTQENTSVRELWYRNGVLDESGNVRNRDAFLASAA